MPNISVFYNQILINIGSLRLDLNWRLNIFNTWGYVDSDRSWIIFPFLPGVAKPRRNFQNFNLSLIIKTLIFKYEWIEFVLKENEKTKFWDKLLFYFKREHSCGVFVVKDKKVFLVLKRICCRQPILALKWCSNECI